MQRIKFVRTYSYCGCDWVDAIYNSGRVFTWRAEKIPSTVLDFIVTARTKTKQYVKTFDRTETIYEA